MIKLNHNTFNLLLTYNYHTKEIPFFNFMVTVDKHGNFTSKLYREPMAGNSLLSYYSSHATLLKRSIPFAQYLRLRQICTTLDDFKIQAGGLQSQPLGERVHSLSPKESV